MGARVEQSGEFLPRAGRARCRHLEDMANSIHRLPSAAEDLYVIVPCRNRALLLQGEFCITLKASVKAAQKIEREQWGRAVLFAVAAIIILVAVAKIH